MDRNEPLVSVIVPVYNGQEYLENCIRSIQEQTYGNLEILIVNDGSTDATGSVCDKLAGMYDNVRVLTLGDEGVSAGRNAGIEAAKGELITFVDADDRLRPDMLRTLYECMTKTGSEVAGCRFFSWRNEEDWEQALAVETVSDRIECYEPHRYLRDALLQGNSRCWSKLPVDRSPRILKISVPGIVRLCDPYRVGKHVHQKKQILPNRQFLPKLHLL